MKVRSKQEAVQVQAVQNVVQPQVVQQTNQTVPPTTVSTKPDYKNVYDISQDGTRVFYFYPNSNTVLCEPNTEDLTDPLDHWERLGKAWGLLN